jgi:hypothetical protein
VLFFTVTPGAIQGYTPFYIFLTATVAPRYVDQPALDVRCAEHCLRYCPLGRRATAIK